MVASPVANTGGKLKFYILSKERVMSVIIISKPVTIWWFRYSS